MTSPTIIAIDGPAASGKGVIARAVAAHFGFAHLDTGLLYRALGYTLRATPDFSEADAVAAAKTMHGEGLAMLLGQEAILRQENVGALASRVAMLSRVRKELRAWQRQFAAHPPGDAAGAVLEGRDIATVICPEAQVKLYVDASLDARAQRRFLEMKRAAEADGKPSVGISAAEIRTALEVRDRLDRQRNVAPLRRADSALLLDNSKLGIQESIARGIALVESRIGRGRLAQCGSAQSHKQG